MPADTLACGGGIVTVAPSVLSSTCELAHRSGRRYGKLFLICGPLFLFGTAVGTTYHWGTLTHPNLLAPPDDLNNWQVYTGGTAQATYRREGRELRLDVSAVDGTARHVQCFQRGINVREGHTYTLRFRARADEPREMWVEAHLDQPDYHNVGLRGVVPLVPQWQVFVDTFRATRVLTNDTSVPCFVVGSKAGTVWLADISLSEANFAEDAGRTRSSGRPHFEGLLKEFKEVHGDL